MTWIRIGKIVRAVGLDGRVGVAGTSGSLESLPRVRLQRGAEPGPSRAVLDARPQGRVWAMLLEGVSDRNAAEACVGSEVLALRADLGEAGEGLHYWADLEGLAVVTVAGQAVGTVTGLMETGAVDVLVVKGERGEVLIPLAPYVTVDGAQRRIVVDPPEGLLEVEESGEGGPERGD